MVKRIDAAETKVVFTFEGEPIQAYLGDSIAAALTAAGIRNLRESVVSGEPRGIYCMMGACFDCLVEVDGISNRQACMTLVVDGLIVRRQRACVEVKG